MVAKSYILKNLKLLDRKYREAATVKDATFASKLALLELGGWIEESMDDVVLKCATNHLKVVGNLNYCKQDIIKRTYGFDYQNHFRWMLIRLVGLIAVEKIERQVDASLHARMAAALTTLKAQRDAEAHTHLKGTTRTLAAPSVTITHFEPVYDGLMEFQRVIRANKW